MILQDHLLLRLKVEFSVFQMIKHLYSNSQQQGKGPHHTFIVHCVLASRTIRLCISFKNTVITDLNIATAKKHL